MLSPLKWEVSNLNFPLTGLLENNKTISRRIVFHRYPDTDTDNQGKIHTYTDTNTLDPYQYWYQIPIPKSQTDTNTKYWYLA